MASSLRSFQASRIMAARSSAQRMNFSVAATLRAGKESSLGEDASKRAADIEKNKQEQLRAQKEGKAEWKDSLASDSESIVKADRGEVKDTQQAIKELQEESKKV